MALAEPGTAVLDCPAPRALAGFYAEVLGGTVEDLDAAEGGVLALGARPLDTDDRSRTFRVYADPAGHPFCLCAR
ncbi:VOC family protein [Streptomyces sp. NPDC046915]|uniref:VOC family protein n=1 Tax=Streptomyces sp. NPDC046915 TaxID=3155257 RepID=UPI003409F5B1